MNLRNACPMGSRRPSLTGAASQRGAANRCPCPRSATRRRATCTALSECFAATAERTSRQWCSPAVSRIDQSSMPCTPCARSSDAQPWAASPRSFRISARRLSSTGASCFMVFGLPITRGARRTNLVKTGSEFYLARPQALPLPFYPSVGLERVHARDAAGGERKVLRFCNKIASRSSLSSG